MGSKKVIMGDPSLKFFSGHCYEYFHFLARPFKEMGCEVEMIGNKRADISLIKKGNVGRCFTYWCDERHVSVPVEMADASEYDRIRAGHEAMIYKDLSEFFRGRDFSSDDVIVLNTLRHWQIRGVVQWYESLSLSRQPSLVLILHFTAFPNPEKYDQSYVHYVEAFERIKASSASFRIHLLADSQALVDQMWEMSGLRVHLAPIPHVARPAKEDGRSSEVINVSYLGEARLNKGFDLLPYVTEQFLHSPLASMVRFHIQTFCFDYNADFVKRAISRFGSNVTTYNYELSPEEYASLFEITDVSIIPYRNLNYYAQTSGVFAESLAAGKPSIVPRGSWMAEQLRTYTGGGVSFIPEDPIDLFEKTYAVIEDYTNRRQTAQVAAQKWSQFHSPERLAQLIVDISNEDCI